MPKRNWTRQELIVAFNLYCRTPFGRIHTRNPEIIALAEALERSPSAVSYKLANFSSLDPAILGRNLSGASHSSRLDKEVWDEFNGNWDRLAFESEQLLANLLGRPLEADPVEEPADFPEGTTRDAAVKVRVNQRFFRQAVIAAYGARCCITGISHTELLNASHIIPWRADEPNRTNPRNGLCLSALHDRAFDRGLISFDERLRVIISPQLSRCKDDGVARHLLSYKDSPLLPPKSFHPDPAFLEWHRSVLFQK